MAINVDKSVKFSLDRKILKRIDRFLDILSPSEGEEEHILKVIRVVDLDTGLTIEGGEINKMVLTDTQQVTIEFGRPVDKKGFPAQVDESSLAFSISDDSAVITQDADNKYKALIVASRPHADGESAVISLKADADLGEGVVEITGVEALVVTAGQAFGFGPATFGTPEEQP